MQRHFERELEGLKTNLIKMGSIVEEAVTSAMKALIDRDIILAQRILDGDERINSLEIEIDNSIVDLLALQQPVAVDLRLILAAQKINNDLERIGDHAVNIAESAIAMARLDKQDTFLELPQMAEFVETMLRNAIDGFIHRDATLAKKVFEMEDAIDELNRTTSRKVVQLLNTNEVSIEGGLDLIRVSRNLERVADLATNISEEIIFMARAEIVKHHAAEKKQ
ncbi:MAG TPA: phosphate signaling complex protein PhoU [Bacteroidota bacterium]|nr:phosphate signaling complex protein PhoU [Bacteroidota bacterium]